MITLFSVYLAVAVPAWGVKYLQNTTALPFEPSTSRNADLAVYLGIYKSPEDCYLRCKSFRNTEAGTSPVSGWTRCQSFTHFGPGYFDRSLTGQCFGWLDAGGPSSAWRQSDWRVGQTKGATSVSMTVAYERDFSCANDSDCSLNGVCQKNKCSCSAAWSGQRCETLQLLPVRRNALGLHTVESNGRNTSSWGGKTFVGNRNRLLQ